MELANPGSEVAHHHSLPSFRQQRERLGRLPVDDCRALASSGLGGILHCFTGSVDHARRALDMGFMISFAGNITFPKAQPIRDAAQMVPLDRMLIETDSPYLAPIPHRGQRNEPAFVREVARQIGELRGVSSAEEIGSQTTQNFYKFFALTSDPADTTI